MTLAVTLSVLAIVVLGGVLAVDLYDDWQWQKRVDQLADLHRATHPDATPWGEVIRVPDDLKLSHARPSNKQGQ
jgi:hypothetical protein